ncbi:hypothetical protein [Roseateles sp.]|uniref:hypothetical protein n=1 Tax=Roseateles sp. TaxID=1971397 RepID=UPI0031DBA5F6
MNPLPSASIDPNQGFGIGQTSENAHECLESCIETARNQNCFYDSDRQSAEEFMASLADYRLAKQELLCTATWLVSLLPRGGPDWAVHSGFKRWCQGLDGSSSDVTLEGVGLLGKCKRTLFALCLALEADNRTSTVAAACLELREAFREGEVQSDSLTRAASAALLAVRAQDGTSRPVATPALQSRPAAPKRGTGDIPEDCFTGLVPTKSGTESFDAFLARNRGDAVGQLASALDVLECKALDAGVVPDEAARALAPCRASASAMASQGPSGTDDEVLSLGLKLYALDQLFSRLDSPHGDPLTKRDAVARLMSEWASSSSSSYAQVGALFQTLRELDMRLAGSDPLSCSFLDERARLMTEVLAQVVEGMDDERDVFRGSRDHFIAAAHEQLRYLLGLPPSAPISDRAELDATTLTRVFFKTMPAWRDGAVIARMADRQLRNVIPAVEARVQAQLEAARLAERQRGNVIPAVEAPLQVRWEAIDVDAAQGALAELSSLASAGDRQWSLPMKVESFCHVNSRREARLHRDSNPTGLYWASLLRERGLVWASVDRIASWEEREHPTLAARGSVCHVQGALCGVRSGGNWYTIGPWAADQFAPKFMSDRLRRVVIDAIEAAQPDASHRLSQWRISADGAITVVEPTPSLASATPAVTASPTQASLAAVAEAASVEARGATASSSPAIDAEPPAFEADAFLVRLLSVVEQLRDHVVDAGLREGGLDSLLKRVDGQRPNGTDHDEIGMLHLLGIDGLNRICDALDRIVPGELSAKGPLDYLLEFLKGPNSTMGILNVALQLSPRLWGQEDARRMHNARKNFLQHELERRALALPVDQRHAAVSGARATVRQLLGWEPFAFLSTTQWKEAARLVDLSAPGLFALHQAAEAAALRKIQARRAQ